MRYLQFQNTKVHAFHSFYDDTGGKNYVLFTTLVHKISSQQRNQEMKKNWEIASKKELQQAENHLSLSSRYLWIASHLFTAEEIFLKAASLFLYVNTKQ